MNIGVTGHRKLPGQADWNWVEMSMRRELVSLSPKALVAVTCLAIGADQLFARLVVAAGGQIQAVLPFADYLRTFAPLEQLAYRQLLFRSRVEILTIPGTDEDAYLAAGCRVVDQSDLLFIIWDGLLAKGKGGTADVAAFAAEREIPRVHFNPRTRTVVRCGSLSGLWRD